MQSGISKKCFASFESYVCVFTFFEAYRCEVDYECFSFANVPKTDLIHFDPL